VVSTRRDVLRWGLASAVGSALLGGTAAAPGGFDQLRRHVDGQLVLPQDREYARARRSQMREHDHLHPAAVLYAAGVEDARRAVLFAQDRGIELSVRSGGHHLEGWSTGDGLVLDLSRVNRATAVTGPNSVAVGPATTSLESLEALDPHGLALPSGICATVCPGGFVTGGGVGLMMPHSGLGADHLRAAEVVLADGRVVTASADSEPDLHWALRGGGAANFGVVTRLSLRADPLGRVTNYLMAWPFEAADRVGAAWQHWQAAQPEALGSALMLLHADELPGAVPLVVAMGIWTGSPESLRPRLDELAEQAEQPPLVDLDWSASYREAMLQWWALDTTLPARPVTEDLLRPAALLSDVAKAVQRRPALRTIQGRFFDRPMPAEGIDAWINAFASDRRPGQSRLSMALRTGGAAGRPSRTSTAYPHRDASFHLDFSAQQNGWADLPADKEAADAWSARGLRAITPHSTGEAYMNFPEPHLPHYADAYWAENLDRLSAVKRAYDPHHLFRPPQGVPAR